MVVAPTHPLQIPSIDAALPPRPDICKKLRTAPGPPGPGERWPPCLPSRQAPGLTGGWAFAAHRQDTRARCHPDGYIPSPLSSSRRRTRTKARCVLRCGATRTRERSRHCLAAGHAPFGLLLAAHSPSSGLWSTRLTKPGTGVPAPAAREVPRLSSIVIGTVTLLGDVGPRSFAVCTELPLRHSLRPHRGDFGRQKPEAPPYPPTKVFRGSAPSPGRLTGKPLRASHG